MPCDLLGSFKPRLLYLIAGLYSTGRYNTNKDKSVTTDVTIGQLEAITGDKKFYIKESLFTTIRKRNSEYVKWNGNFYTHNKERGDIQKRNRFSLLKASTNFRIIQRGIFQDDRFTPDEKGYIIALYMLCVNNTFRFDLSDAEIAKRLDVSLNTWKKYKAILINKGVIQEFKDAPAHMVDLNFEEALVLNYEHLGYSNMLKAADDYYIEEVIAQQEYIEACHNE